MNPGEGGACTGGRVGEDRPEAGRPRAPHLASPHFCPGRTLSTRTYTHYTHTCLRHHRDPCVPGACVGAAPTPLLWLFPTKFPGEGLSVGTGWRALAERLPH